MTPTERGDRSETVAAHSPTSSGSRSSASEDNRAIEARSPPGQVKDYREGTHRVCSPDETWRRIQPLFPQAGISRVADVTRLDRLGIPVFQAVRPASRNLSVSQGKGATAMAARVSAAMEALELRQAEDLSDLPSRRVSPSEIAADNPIRSRSLPWKQSASRFEHEDLDWLPAVGLTSPDGWLPRQAIELDFRLPPVATPQPFHRSSNGLASGNCYEEAALHALCELIERHALALVESGRVGRRALAEDPGGSPRTSALLDRLREAGARFALWDLTWEVGIPTVVAEFVLPDLARIWAGSGCHPSADVALSRAVTEAAQSRLTFISGARDDVGYGHRPERAVDAFETFQASASDRTLDDLPILPSLSSDRVDRDLAAVAERLARLGHPPYVVDLSRQAIDISTVKAFAPGLQEAHLA